MIEAMTCTEPPAAAMGPPSRSAEGSLGTMRQEQSCLAIAVEDSQTECFFECRENIVGNGPHKRADQSQTKRTEGQKFCGEKTA